MLHSTEYIGISDLLLAASIYKKSKRVVEEGLNRQHGQSQTSTIDLSSEVRRVVHDSVLSRTMYEMSVLTSKAKTSLERQQAKVTPDFAQRTYRNADTSRSYSPNIVKLCSLQTNNDSENHS